MGKARQIMEGISNFNMSGRIMFHDKEYARNSFGGQMVTVFTIANFFLLFVILFFISFVYDKKIDGERVPLMIPTRPVHGFRKYMLITETGGPVGGTSSTVFIRFMGNLTKTPAFSLGFTASRSLEYLAGRKILSSMNKDMFLFCLPHYLGDIEAFEISFDKKGENPPWYCKTIRVMCLDNKKCWKSEVKAWLRGDKKPYHIKAHAINALGTNDYMKRTFIQHHFWLSMWNRKLGSHFSCKQRCAVHFVSLTSGLAFAHYMIYEPELVKNVSGGTSLMVPAFTGTEMFIAAMSGAAAGTIAGVLFRILIRLGAGRFYSERLNDKDDFAHVIRPKSMVYAHGGVVKCPKNLIEHFSSKQMPHLSQDQIKLIKHLLECKEQDCKMKDKIFHPKKVCSESPRCKAAPHDPTPSARGGDGCSWVSDDEVEDGDGKPLRVSFSDEQLSMINNMLDNSRKINDIAKADSIAGSKVLNVLWEEDKDGDDVASTPSPSLASRVDLLWNAASNMMRTVLSAPHAPPRRKHRSARSRAPGVPPRPKRDKKRMNTVPQVSTGPNAPQPSSAFDSDDDDDSESLVDDVSRPKLPLKQQLEDPYWDSLSDADSDVDFVTRPGRSPSEAAITRRPEEMYIGSPMWCDKWRVWVQGDEHSEEHHKKLGERYRFTSRVSECCLRTEKAMSFYELILRYAEQEREAPLGNIKKKKGRFQANGCCLIMTFLEIGALCGIAYQRVPLPNPDSLLYLYCMILTLLFHAFVTSSADAFLWCAFYSTNRRRKMQHARYKNARILGDDVHEDLIVKPGDEDVTCCRLPPSEVAATPGHNRLGDPCLVLHNKYNKGKQKILDVRKEAAALEDLDV